MVFQLEQYTMVFLSVNLVSLNSKDNLNNNNNNINNSSRLYYLGTNVPLGEVVLREVLRN